MIDAVEPLICDLLEFVHAGERSYSEVMAAWRTSCPRLPVWEEANARGFIERRRIPGCEATLFLTNVGLRFLRENRRTAAHSAVLAN